MTNWIVDSAGKKKKKKKTRKPVVRAILQYRGTTQLLSRPDIIILNYRYFL